MESKYANSFRNKYHDWVQRKEKSQVRTLYHALTRMVVIMLRFPNHPLSSKLLSIKLALTVATAKISIALAQNARGAHFAERADAAR